jgi:hypothetical protein
MNMNSDVVWEQGQVGTEKGGGSFGFPAYSYSDSVDEYAFSQTSSTSNSDWLITPVLSVKNGDMISFYTRASDGDYADHLQVSMNKSTSTDIGSFTTVLFDIPSHQGSDYPTTWTKYEYAFSGISGSIDTRVAFRHYLANGLGYHDQGIGIDVFKFDVK